MPDVEVAFDLGMLGDANLDTTTVATCWFMTAWAVHGSRWVAKAQQAIDEVVGRDRLPEFEDRTRLAYIDAISKYMSSPLYLFVYLAFHHIYRPF